MADGKPSEETQLDIKAIRMRNYIDPKRFYKSVDAPSRFVQVARARIHARPRALSRRHNMSMRLLQIYVFPMLRLCERGQIPLSRDVSARACVHAQLFEPWHPGAQARRLR